MKFKETACDHMPEAECGLHQMHRASSSNVCDECGEPYWKHPHCANSELPESMRSSTVSKEYSLHVLCDGRHVKL